MTITFKKGQNTETEDGVVANEINEAGKEIMQGDGNTLRRLPRKGLGKPGRAGGSEVSLIKKDYTHSHIAS